MKQDIHLRMSLVDVNVDYMQVFVIINNVETVIDSDVMQRID